MAIAINMIINFTIVPYISNQIGLEAYGFVNLANTMITYIDIISIALNAFACRYIAIEYHRGNYGKSNQYYSSTIISNLCLSAAIVVVGIIFVTNIQKVLKISNGLLMNVQILFYTVIVRYIFVLMRNAFDVSTFISNRLDLTEKLRSISYIIQVSILLACIINLSPKVWYVGLTSAIASFFLFISQFLLTKKLTPRLHFSANEFSLHCVLDLLSSGIWNSLNNLGNVLNSGLDLIVANLMISGTGMGQISIATTLSSLCYTMVTAISNSFRPKQLELYSKNKKVDLIHSLIQSMKITGIISSIIISGFISCGSEFLQLWLNNYLNINVIYRLSIIALLGIVATGVVNPLYYVFTLTNKLRVPCIITIAMGILNLISMVLLIRTTDIGIYAIVMTTMALNSVHFIDTPIYAAHCLQIKWHTFYGVILKHISNILLSSMIMLLVNTIYPVATSWISLIMKIIIYGIIGLLISVILNAKYIRIVVTQRRKSK